MNDLAKNETRELTSQETLFCDAYADAESETYGNGTESAKLAKYSHPHNASWKLKQRPVVKDRLNQIYEKNKAGIGKVMSDLEHERLLAIRKGDISSAIRASELQGKRLGAFSEKHIFLANEEPRPDMSPEKIAEMREFADSFYAHKYLAQPVSQTNDDYSQETPITPPTGSH